jgi:hypothetical protein
MLAKYISNEDLRKTTGQEDINTGSNKRKLRWIGYALRKENGDVPNSA